MAKKVFDYSTQGDIIIEEPRCWFHPVTPVEVAIAQKESPYMSYDEILDEEAFDEAWANKPITKGKKDVPLWKLREKE